MRQSRQEGAHEPKHHHRASLVCPFDVCDAFAPANFR
jgi:hypothetical protein